MALGGALSAETQADSIDAYQHSLQSSEERERGGGERNRREEKG